MENTNPKRAGLWPRVRGEGQSFLDAVRKSNETIYLALLTLYVALFFLLKVAWTKSAEPTFDILRMVLLSMILWGTALYLFFIIAAWKKLWKKNVPLILTGAALLGITFWGSKKMSTNSYGVVMDVVFCLLACGKDYKKILRCMLGAVVIVLIIAAIGIPIGFTMDLQKPDNPSPGHSIGINYPNSWGYMAFVCMLIAWYLWMRKRPWITFPFFWGMTAFMYFYVSCRTIAVLAAVFPFIATVVDLMETRSKKRAESAGAGPKKIGAGGWIVVAIPFLAFAVMLFLSMNVEWVHAHFYHGKLHTLAMRFVLGGLYFRTYGFPIVGNPYTSNVYNYVNVNGEFLQVGILDSAFAAYIIMRGLFWMAYTLSWLSFAIYKALKRRDYAIPFLCGIILVFAMMERPGLDMWYNFILLYPLAKVAGDAVVEPQPVADASPAEAFEAAELPAGGAEAAEQ